MKYKCRPEMKLKDIKDRDVIINLLNDNGEWLFWIYLASIYQKFINWQNTFLNNIIRNINQKGVLYFFLKKN